VGAIAEHERAERAVRHLRGDVEHARHPRERIQVLRKRFPAPVDPLVERGAGDVLDALHQLDEEALLAAAHRREADAAVSHHERGHAVPARRREQRIPRDLTVVVRVHVDPSGQHQQVTRVDLALAAPADIAHRAHCAGVDRHVALEARRAGAVDDRSVPDHQVMHGDISSAQRSAEGKGGDVPRSNGNG
jgi:hypothetical protein